MLTQDTRILIPNSKGTDSLLSVKENNRERRGTFSIIIGLAVLAYRDISAFLN